MKLLDLPKKVRNMLNLGELSPSVAREIAWAGGEVRADLIKGVSKQSYTSRSVRMFAKSLCKEALHCDTYSTGAVAKNTDRRDERILNEAITSTRILMMRLDFLIDKVPDENLIRIFLVELRSKIHEQVDTLIRLRRKLDRQRWESDVGRWEPW